jgi:hypothetical protein
MFHGKQFVLAVEKFIKRHRNREILEALNKVYPDMPDQAEEVFRERMRRKHGRLVREDWS